MTFTDNIAILQTVVVVLSLLRGVGQATVASSSRCHRCLLLSVLSLAVLSCMLNMIILGLTDHRSDLHFIVIGMSAIAGSLQVIVLGLATRKKIASSHKLTYITPAEVWSLSFLQSSNQSNYLTYLFVLYFVYCNIIVYLSIETIQCKIYPRLREHSSPRFQESELVVPKYLEKYLSVRGLLSGARWGHRSDPREKCCICCIVLQAGGARGV